MDESTNLISLFRPAGIPLALLVVLATYTFNRFVTGAIERLAERFTEWRLSIEQSKAVLRLLIVLTGLLLATSMVVELSREALLALGGTLAVAVGISLRDLVSSIVAGITILIDRPFQVGDRVTYGELYGEVASIGLRCVRLVTLDDSVVTIPNNKFLTDVVMSGNAGALDMLVQIDFFIGLEEDLATAKSLVGEVVVSSRFTYLEKPWTVTVAQVAHVDTLALRLRAKVYVLDVRYETSIVTDVTERVTAAFAKHEIRPPVVLIGRPEVLVA